MDRMHRSFYLMKNVCFSCRSFVAVAVLGAGLVALPRLRAASPRESVLIDFTSFHRDPDGTISRPYEYAYGDWEKHVVDLAGRGTLVQAPSGKGGLGENKTALSVGKTTVVELEFVIGNANQSAAINFSLEDRDGTEQSWTIPLSGKPSGQVLRQKFDLGKSDAEPKPGKTSGMNLKKITTWQVRGNWTDSKVEVLLVKLTQEK